MGNPRWHLRVPVNGAVLIFDGEMFRLERLHRAVKRLRHVRQPGESAAFAASAGPAAESYSPPLGKVVKSESSKKVLVPPLSLQVECIETSNFESGESRKEKNSEFPLSILNKTTASPDRYKSEEQMDVVNDDDDNDGLGTSKEDSAFENVSTGISIDINEPCHNDMDDEIADVDKNVVRARAVAVAVAVEVRVVVAPGAAVVIVKAVMVVIQLSLFKRLETLMNKWEADLEMIQKSWILATLGTCIAYSLS
ncbi:hypothetical protein V6N13_107059 [Hibiscus sabdariffa]